MYRTEPSSTELQSMVQSYLNPLVAEAQSFSVYGIVKQLRTNPSYTQYEITRAAVSKICRDLMGLTPQSKAGEPLVNLLSNLYTFSVEQVSGVEQVPTSYILYQPLDQTKLTNDPSLLLAGSS